MYHSVLSAVTGSFFAAFLEGMNPPISVSRMLSIISTKALNTGSDAFTSVVSATLWMTALHGISSRRVIPIPISPANSPMINVSALNTCEIFFFEAPIARRMPISFVLSSTEI